MRGDTGGNRADREVRSMPSAARRWLFAVLLAMSNCGGPADEPQTADEARVATLRHALQVTGGKGLWGARREGGDRRRLAERLFALGYLDGMRPAKDTDSTVTAYDPSRAWNGLNLYVAGHAEQADLIDMEGQLRHRWTFDFASMGARPAEAQRLTGLYFRRASVFPNGDLLALYDNSTLVKLDKDSHLIWAYPKRPHHEFEVLPDGDIVVLTAEARQYPAWHESRGILDNSVVRLDPEGKERSRLSILEAIHHSTVPGLWNRLREELPTKMGKLGDVLHGNSIQTIDAGIARVVPLLQPGHLVVSLPIIHTVVVIDPGSQRVVWALQGTFRYQHHAKFLPTGHLLLFDNQRGPDGQSAVQEIEPITGKTVWNYRGTTEHPFSSWCCGTTYRLPNGNTLIVETEGGRAFEVTSTGETVWDFVNPNRAGEKHELVAQMFDLIRIDPALHRSWLGSATSSTWGPAPSLTPR